MAVSRRTLLLGGAAAAVAIPVGSQLWWSSKDFVREGFDPALPKAPAGERAWVNWSGIQKATPKSLLAPANAKELAAQIRTTPAPVRPVGSGHSFTPLCPSEGTMIDVSAMSGLVSHDIAAGIARMGAGTRLQQAARLLHEQGLAFANLPDIDVQTLAGGFGTATHGTGRNLTAIHDYVRGFEMVTPAGETLEVSADQQPELFQAGKVSLGVLGIIARYDLAVEPAFNLHRRVKLVKTEEILDQYLALSEKHRNFEALFFPGTGHGATLIHDKYDGAVEGEEPNQDEDFLADLRQLRDYFGWWPWLRRKIFETSTDPDTGEDMTDAGWKLLATSRPTKFNEMEYHIPLDNGMETLRKVLSKMESRKDAFFPIEARVTAPDDAWLSPFNDGRRLSIAIHAQADENYEFFFSEFEPIFRAAGGRPHWGKLHSLTAKDLAALYPQFGAFNDLRQQLDPDGKMLNPYMAKLLGAG
ncbi:D-arabinono-1,4-lactone oxidase [Sphingorhabdus sp. EL138]|uniref:D-arabinono-1,4-lactone oxidase n=1 Tax=Sphingorhabdus sp. EL138 TaxID=2073156 RepID=UPI000D68E5A9|nr:D-arabinono-1,4-lactone oxidase [Sphingorhabdus sp. EL138]